VDSRKRKARKPTAGRTATRDQRIQAARQTATTFEPLVLPCGPLRYRFAAIDLVAFRSTALLKSTAVESFRRRSVRDCDGIQGRLPTHESTYEATTFGRVAGGGLGARKPTMPRPTRYDRAAASRGEFFLANHE
jgi:hypothetical protein